nr:CBO0543 family protein [Desulfosporosinus orientis]
MTWAVGLGVVELRLIEYPVRLFPYANRTSFSFEYFIYPSICAISRSC